MTFSSPHKSRLRKILLVKLSLLGLCLVAFPVRAAGPPSSANEITWLVIDYPPYSILQGKQAGQGAGDVLTRLLQSKLKNFRHRQEVATPTEIMANMRTGTHVCSVPYIRTPEREGVMAFSVPALISQPVGVTIRRESLPRFGDGKPVSLPSLLEDHDLRLGVAFGRSYGPELDAILAAHKSDRNIYHRQGVDVYRGLFEMLAQGSIDYVLGLPQEALYFSREDGLGSRVLSVRLTNSTDYIVGRVACARGPWGDRVISAINDILRVERPSKQYLAMLEAWVDDPAKPEFERQYELKIAHAE